MITVDYEISIHRPAEEVFRFVADPRNDPQWCPPVVEVNQIAGSTPERGARYSFVAKPGPFRTEGTFEIVDFKPNERAAYTGENGILRFNYYYEFSPEGGATRLRMRSELTPKGLWKLLQPVIRSDTKKGTVEEFENLKRLLEREHEHVT